RYYLNNLGYLYGQARDWARAEDAYHRGSEASPNTPLIWGGLRNMQFALGKFDATRATIDSFASRFPEHTSADRGPIWFATAMRDFSTAEELLAQYRAKHRDRPARLAWASMQESQLAQMRGKLRDAERHLRDLLAIQVQEGWTDRALWTSMDVAWIEAWFRNDKPRAAALLDTALRRYPLDGVALADRPYLRMADAWAYFGRPDQARGVLAEYERVVDPAIREGAPFEYGVRGQIALAEGRPNEGVGQYRRFDREISCPVCVLPDLARAYDVLGERDSALVVYERYVDTPWIFRAANDASSLAPAYKRLGELYEERGDREKAMKYYGDFADLWAEADPELQPVVRDVRARIARLVGEAKTN
ncbi:MAG: tetratricopeptide repeat protein, partial [Gemmatimonadota bacterium]|nr:tetratricopeptide repeat protein [Gemmatimonadota bacterium]